MHFWKTKLWKKNLQMRKQKLFKMGSNKICIREDLAKEKMVFSQESSQAVFDHHVYTSFSKEQFSAHAASTSDPTRRWYDVSKLLLKYSKHSAFVPHRSIQGVANTAPTCGRHTSTRRSLYEVLKKGKRHYTSIWDRWQNETCKQSQLAIGWSEAFVIWIALRNLKSHIKRRKNKEKGITTNFIYVVPMTKSKGYL